MTAAISRLYSNNVGVQETSHINDCLDCLRQSLIYLLISYFLLNQLCLVLEITSSVIVFSYMKIWDWYCSKVLTYRNNQCVCVCVCVYNIYMYVCVYVCMYECGFTALLLSRLVAVKYTWKEDHADTDVTIFYARMRATHSHLFSL